MHHPRTSVPYNVEVARQLIAAHGITAEQIWKAEQPWGRQRHTMAEVCFNPDLGVLAHIGGRVDAMEPSELTDLVWNATDTNLGPLMDEPPSAAFVFPSGDRSPRAQLRQLACATLLATVISLLPSRLEVRTAMTHQRHATPTAPKFTHPRQLSPTSA